VSSEIEQRVRELIERLEHGADVQVGSTTSRDHWFNCGKDEAYDNVLDWLYCDVLQEQR